MKWEEVVAANDERVKKKRTLEGPEKDNCWWRKEKKKIKK